MIKKEVFTKKSVVEEYVRKHQKSSNASLARKIYKENKGMFQNIEATRSMIRSIKGTLKSKRSMAPIPDLIESRKGKENPFYFPESHAEDYTPYIIPQNVHKLLVLSDIHIPYHDVEALTLAVEYGLKEKCDGILLNGDLIDFYQMSKYAKDPRKRSFSGELEDTRNFLKKLRELFPDAHIYYKLGNHCERFEKYMYTKAPELLDVNDFQLDVLLRLGELKINYIADKRIVKFGSLSILHGHEFIGAVSQAVNPARGLFMKTIESCIMSHLHKSSSHSEQTLSGELKTTWSTGCLSDLHPDYAKINKWNHGFAVVERLTGKDYTVHIKNIYNGKIL